MSDRIEKILNSIKGIKPAEVKPYFYTRLSTKLDTIQNNEAFYLKYERPFLIMLVAVMMALNLFFITTYYYYYWNPGNSLVLKWIN